MFGLQFASRRLLPLLKLGNRANQKTPSLSSIEQVIHIECHSVIRRTGTSIMFQGHASHFSNSFAYATHLPPSSFEIDIHSPSSSFSTSNITHLSTEAISTSAKQGSLPIRNGPSSPPLSIHFPIELSPSRTARSIVSRFGPGGQTSSSGMRYLVSSRVRRQ